MMSFLIGAELHKRLEQRRDELLAKEKERQLREWLYKQHHSENQPRVPAGSPEGGQFGGGGGMKIEVRSNISSDALHPEVQQATEAVSKDLAEQFPEVAKDTTLVYERRNNATFDPWDREIKLPVAGKNEPIAVVDQNEDAANPAGYVVTAGLRGTIVHEFGHAADHYIKRHADDRLRGQWFDAKRALQGELGAASAYGGKIGEWLPERFTAEFLGRESPKLIPAMREYLKQATAKEYLIAWLAKRGHWEDQPRVPAGSPEGGQFGDGGGTINPNASGVDRRVSTTVPSPAAARRGGFDSHTRQDLEPSYGAFKDAMKNPKFAANVDKIMDRYGGQFLRLPPNATTEQKAEAFVEHAKSNIVALYNAQDATYRDRSKDWYEGANKISGDLAKEYSVSEKTAAAVLATLSPQRDWDQNVDLGRRVLDIYKNRDVPVTGEVAARAREAMLAYRDKSQKELDKAEAGLPGLTKPSEVRAAERVIRNRKDAIATMNELSSTFEGKSLSQLSEDMQPFAARFVSVARDPPTRGFQIWNPEGTPSGQMGRNDPTPAQRARGEEGSLSKVGWGGFDQIGNALSVMRDDSNANISRALGDNHKVRNFYNNITSPNYGRDTTIDTHAVAASMLMPIGQSSPLVREGLGMSGPSNADTGLKGLYALHYEAYRRAARDVSKQEDRLVLPRQMQSASWEAVRGLYSDTEKRDVKLRAANDAIWRRYYSGDISLEAAQKAILEKGISPPRWAK